MLLKFAYRHKRCYVILVNQKANERAAAMLKITPDRVPALIASVGSKIAFALFRKRNGEMRKMWFHGKIPSWMVNGKGAPYDPKEYRISFVRDVMLDHAIRSIRWDAVEYLAVNGKKYKVEPKNGSQKAK